MRYLINEVGEERKLRTLTLSDKSAYLGVSSLSLGDYLFVKLGYFGTLYQGPVNDVVVCCCLWPFLSYQRHMISVSCGSKLSCLAPSSYSLFSPQNNLIHLRNVHALLIELRTLEATVFILFHSITLLITPSSS